MAILFHVGFDPAHKATVWTLILSYRINSNIMFARLLTQHFFGGRFQIICRDWWSSFRILSKIMAACSLQLHIIIKILFIFEALLLSLPVRSLFWIGTCKIVFLSSFVCLHVMTVLAWENNEPQPNNPMHLALCSENITSWSKPLFRLRACVTKWIMYMQWSR